MSASSMLTGERADEALAATADSSVLAVETILARSAGENFPVAMRWLPPAHREALMAIYGYARLVDQIGDDAPGDRLAQLDAISRDVSRIADGEPRHPIVRRLAPVVRRHALPLEALERLVEANRCDQTLSRVATWDALVETCTLSADPVGELVLGLFDARTPSNVKASDAICTGLQVIEHCQDVAEDLVRGRVYLPVEDLARLGGGEADLTTVPATPALRGTIALQVARARALFAEADGLLAELPALAVVLVAGYAAGGLATADALERHGFDVVSTAVRPRRRDLLRHWIRLVARRVLGTGVRR